ncbi:MAG: capsule assembly Wzi family protein [Salinibacter sp.]|uniref:capsule assembly Wzi family protein n=1 Tax=Salinibacter sp. TaxID=2065818 RepID=UPI002FC2A42F
MHAPPHQRLAGSTSSLLVGLLMGAGICGLLVETTARPAQAQGVGPIQAEVSVFGAGASTEALPFWLGANQYGRLGRSGTPLGARLAARRPFSGAAGGLDYAVGASLLGRASAHSTLHVQELYGQLRSRGLQLTAGWKKQVIGRVDTARSLGGITRSPNATPLPKVSVSTDGYVPVPGTNGFLSVKGYLAHGWMDGDRVVRSPFLHEKYGYLRILPPDGPVTLHAGLIHHALWGGTPTAPVAGQEEGAFRDGLRQFGRVFFALRGSNERGPDHMGNYDFSADVAAGPVKGQVYRQFFFEDKPGLWFRNVWDGLWGVSLQRSGEPSLVDAILYEHFRFIRQNAKYAEGERAGADRNFSQSLYRSGWTYQGRTLGLPLVTPPANTPGVPDDRPGIANSLVVAHHVAVEGTLHQPGLSYRLTGTYSENSGSTSLCSDADCTRLLDDRFSRTSQWSFLMEAFGQVPGTEHLSYDLGVAVDTGDFRRESVGVRVGLTWQGLYDPASR